MIAKSQRWHRTALAAATALLCLWGSDAKALSLGRIIVQSALGEPLRAEIEIPEINAEEAASLKAGVALPEAFRAAGLEYNPAMSGLQVSLQRRADGRAFIRLSSERAINDPFVDMILEASWASGRIVRDYTMLFDPPSLRQASGAVPLAPQVGALPPAGVQPGPVAAAPPATVAARSQPVTPKSAATASGIPKSATDGVKQLRVQPGDTASRIAASNKPANVSLDQMLIALLRANPDAFVRGNLNRIKAGALIDVPTAQQAQATPAAEATQTVIAQSRDFNEFRKKLAISAPAAEVAAPDRASSGSVQAKVTEKKPVATAPDKLTLSKGSVEARAAEDKIARERQAAEAANRAREVARINAELSKLSAASAAAGVAPGAGTAPTKAPGPAPAVAVATAASSAVSAPKPPASVATAPAAPVSVGLTAPTQPAPAPPVPPAVVPVASAAAPAETPASAATPAPVAPPALTASARATTPAPAQPGMLDSVLEHPLVPAGVVALLALLAGLGFYRIRQRRNAGQVDSAFLESRLQPDSFFGASGGQRIDTNDGAATGSSMVYTSSQLDAADDVDPVAEADVYLAYGRDLQAEEILKEALRSNSGRVAIHQKLLEIYAKRRDTKGFESVASQAYKVTSGEGPEWERICDLGLSIDPTNGLYQPGGQPAFGAGASRPAALDDTAGASSSTSSTTQPLTPVTASAPIDLDLDLDFSLDDMPPASPPAPPPPPINPVATVSMQAVNPVATISMQASSSESTVGMRAAPAGAMMLDLDFGLDEPESPAITAAAASKAESQDLGLPELDLPAREPTREHDTVPAPVELAFDEVTGPTPLSVSAASPTVAAPLDHGLMEFDLGSLSLDLGPAGAPAASIEPATPEDPLATKLALAEEFVAIGDQDGARALIEEVIAESSGEMKANAQRALSSLN